MDELSYFPYVLYYVHKMTLMESLTCCTRFQSFHFVKLHVSPAIHQTATDIILDVHLRAQPCIHVSCSYHVRMKRVINNFITEP